MPAAVSPIIYLSAPKKVNILTYLFVDEPFHKNSHIRLTWLPFDALLYYVLHKLAKMQKESFGFGSVANQPLCYN